MTGRERLSAIMHRQKADRLAWTILVDDITLSVLPERVGVRTGFEFARYLGCDVFQLEGWGTPHGFRSPVLEWGSGIEERRFRRDGNDVTELRSSDGVLSAEWRGGHPVKHAVGSLEELGLYTAMWETARFVPVDDSEAFSAVDAAVGDAGIITRFWGPSTVPRLLEYDMGMASFYYLLHDHPAEMERLFRVIHEREVVAFQELAAGPCDVITLVENTSSAYISPDTYRRYNAPHVRDFVDVVHAAGKVALIHMCGHVMRLLPTIRTTKLDGIHALTPPPTGDTPWEMALDIVGEDLVVIGVLDPSIFVMGPVEGIGPALDQLYTRRIRRSNSVLCLAADGIPVPIERFEAVAQWMEANG